VKYIHELNYPIQECVAIQDMFSVNEVQNKPMKIERLRSKAPPSRRPLSIEKPIGDNGIPPNSTMACQPMVQPTAKASTSTPATTLAFTKSKDNTYTKPKVSKYYRCGEPKHRSIECPKKRPINMVDYEEKDDVLIETEPEDSNFVEEHGENIACVIQKVLCNQKVPDTIQ